jgi:AcrR family transcriptional regulator
MEDIAAAAEVGKGTLYRYFKDKDEMYTALLVGAAEQLELRLHQHLQRADGTRATLEAIVSAVLGYFDEQPHLFDLIQHTEATQRPDRAFAWQKTREDYRRLVCNVLTTARDNGEFDVDDPALATLMLLGGIRSVLRFGERPRPEGLVRRIVENFLHGHTRLPVKPNGRNRPAPVVS